ncbi:uncharacterized protein AMSG_12040 [Thecamonas trahens ATCC 50062]|uniref:Glycoside hydrolase family 38 central domain-containing protein n=1 Tax=Thecamonas trahens ATCC 50062 TaxID=461836 RepID=A0A0L0DIF5_THETB|nr:hypothetical protein AMSG_12040 [Thecamonas trahens ATCC 50062]KNC51098.1 hypothetical protein AMSG_12040 [Thecamonas trahens ATCC 50062]|eukprot:XP_013756571.1 hypothetical protein AMSG_12040 [Thecamonas trahens ATCC 50062]
MSSITFLAHALQVSDSHHLGKLCQAVESEAMAIVGAGWVMADEALVPLAVHAANYRNGATYLDSLQCPSGAALAWRKSGVYGYQIDPFGHAASLPVLAKALNWDGAIINRVPRSEKKAVIDNASLDFVWGDLPVSLLFDHYSSPPGFDFEKANVAFDLEDSDQVVAKAAELAGLARHRAAAHPTPHLLLMYGDDFRYTTPQLYTVMDALLAELARPGSPAALDGFTFGYSTIPAYMRAVADATSRPLARRPRDSDYMTYSDQALEHWSGTYTTRASLKAAIAQAWAALAAADALLAVHAPAALPSNAAAIRRSASILAHHDAITAWDPIANAASRLPPPGSEASVTLYVVVVNPLPIVRTELVDLALPQAWDLPADDDLAVRVRIVGGPVIRHQLSRFRHSVAVELVLQPLAGLAVEITLTRSALPPLPPPPPGVRSVVSHALATSAAGMLVVLDALNLESTIVNYVAPASGAYLFKPQLGKWYWIMSGAAFAIVVLAATLGPALAARCCFRYAWAIRRPKHKLKADDDVLIFDAELGAGQSIRHLQPPRDLSPIPLPVLRGGVAALVSAVLGGLVLVAIVRLDAREDHVVALGLAAASLALFFLHLSLPDGMIRSRQLETLATAAAMVVGATLGVLWLIFCAPTWLAVPMPLDGAKQVAVENGELYLLRAFEVPSGISVVARLAFSGRIALPLRYEIGVPHAPGLETALRIRVPAASQLLTDDGVQLVPRTAATSRLFSGNVFPTVGGALFSRLAVFSHRPAGLAALTPYDLDLFLHRSPGVDDFRGLNDGADDGKPAVTVLDLGVDVSPLDGLASALAAMPDSLVLVSIEARDIAPGRRIRAVSLMVRAPTEGGADGVPAADTRALAASWLGLEPADLVETWLDLAPRPTANPYPIDLATFSGDSSYYESSSDSSNTIIHDNPHHAINMNGNNLLSANSSSDNALKMTHGELPPASAPAGMRHLSMSGQFKVPVFDSPLMVPPELDELSEGRGQVMSETQAGDGSGSQRQAMLARSLIRSPPPRRRPLTRPFVRAMVWSLRMGAAVAAAGLAASWEPIRQIVAAPFLIPVFAVIIVNASLAQTLRSGALGIIGAAVGAAVALITQFIPLALLASDSPARVWAQMVAFAVALFGTSFLLRDNFLIIIALVPVIAHSLSSAAATAPPIFDYLAAVKVVFSITLGIITGVLAALPFPHSDAARLDDILLASTQTVASLFTALVDSFLVQSSGTQFRADLQRQRARALFVLLESQMELAQKHHAWLAWDPALFLHSGRHKRAAAYGRLLKAFHELVLTLRCLETTLTNDVVKLRYLEAFRPYIAAPLNELAAATRTFVTALPLSWSRSSSMLSELSVWAAPPAAELSAEPLVAAMARARQEIFYSSGSFDANLPSTTDMINMQTMILALRNVIERTMALATVFETQPEEDPAPAATDHQSMLAAFADLVLGKAPRGTRAAFALRRTGGILIASLIVVVPELTQEFGRNAVWAPLTVCFLMQTSVGGSLKRSFLRLEGTVAGAVFAYFVVVVLGAYLPAVIVLIAAWVVLSGYIRASPQYSYGGLVSAFTAALIAFGNEDPDVSDEAYALARIKQTVLGIAVTLPVTLVAPGPWIGSRLTGALRATVASLGDLMDGVLELALEPSSGHGPQGISVRREIADPTSPQTKALMKPVWAGIAKQEAILGLSEVEPVLWRTPVPRQHWDRVIEVQRDLVHVLKWMDQLTSKGLGDEAHRSRVKYLAALDEQLGAVAHVFSRAIAKLLRDLDLAASLSRGLEYDEETAMLISFMAKTAPKLRAAYEAVLLNHVASVHRQHTGGSVHVKAELDTPLVTQLSATIFCMARIAEHLRLLWEALLDLEHEKRLQGW